MFEMQPLNHFILRLFCTHLHTNDGRAAMESTVLTHRKQVGVHCLVLGHLDMESGGAGVFDGLKSLVTYVKSIFTDWLTDLL